MGDIKNNNLLNKQIKTIDISSKEPDNKAENQLYNMSTEIINLCDDLSAESTHFNEAVFFDSLMKYISKYNRLLYSDISNYIFNTTETKLSSFENNLQKVVNYAYGNVNELITKHGKEKSKNINETKDAAIKLWDHANLAKRQLVQLKQSDNEFKDKFEQNIAPFKQEFTKEMNAQLIALIGLFTAMSFLVFGGVSSLDNIFKGAKDINIIKIMIIGTIWGLCIQNLVFVFMFFVAKLTKLSIKSTDDAKANFVQKYPLMCWSNLVLIFILAFCMWLYFIDYANAGGLILSWSKNNQMACLIIGTSIILIIVCATGYKFIKMYNNKYDN